MHREVATSGVLMLPYTASSVGVARRRLVSDLTEAGVREGPACDAGLVVSELTSNALRHATPLTGNRVKVMWNLGADSITIAVIDGGAETLPRVHEPSRSSLGGRGLGIVARLSIQWGVDVNRGAPRGGDTSGTTAVTPLPEIPGTPETTVWAELPVEYASVPALAALSSRDA